VVLGALRGLKMWKSQCTLPLAYWVIIPYFLLFRKYTELKAVGIW
jgi:hypothetical protein